MIEEKKPLTFRLKKPVIEKLEKIREYHQGVVSEAFLKDNSLVLSKTAIIEGMIEQMYFEMVQDGQIKE